MNPEVRFYFSVFLRRLPLFLLVSLSLTSSGVAVALILPTVFSANASLLVQGPQIPGNLAASTVNYNAAEQLEVIQRRLMTRANLIDIAREYEVYDDLNLLSPDQLVERMRADTRLNSRTSSRQATVLNVAFDARSADIAADVANEYVTRILDSNARTRVRQAEETLSFFEQEVERLETELDLQSARIVRFQNENADALPESLNFRMTRAATLTERLSQIGRDQSTLEDQRARIVQLFETQGAISPAALTGDLTFEEEQLEAVRNRLSAALAVYSEESPQVRQLRSQVAALEAQVAEQLEERRTRGETSEQEPSGTDQPDRAATLFDLQLAEIDARIAFLEEDAKTTKAELNALEDSISKTPNNTIALESLERDYQNVQAQYTRALDRLAAAVTGERIESLAKGERITVIEQAVPPDEPSAPNRRLIAAAGTALGFGGALFLVVALELLNRAVRRPMELTNGLGITPLATIPYISTTAEKLRRRLALLIVLIVVLIAIPAGLYVFHYQVMPLDFVIDRIVDRLRF